MSKLEGELSGDTAGLTKQTDQMYYLTLLAAVIASLSIIAALDNSLKQQQKKKDR